MNTAVVLESETEMQRIFSFTSSAEHYTAEACVVWCFDERFRKLLDAFIEHRAFAHPDRIIIAGGAKSLSSPEVESARDFTLGQIQKSLKLHHPKRIILMTHSDCGAYGGLQAFGSKEAELEKHRIELIAARDALASAIDLTGIEIEMVFADFEGLSLL